MEQGTKPINEEDFKVKQLSAWGIKKYVLNDDRVDVKLKHIWLEVKSKDEDIYTMLSQIIFTAYRARLAAKDLPVYFGCFNSQIGAIIENYQANEVFAYTDIDWKQTPSNLNEKTILTIKGILKEVKTYPLIEFGTILQEIEKRHTLSKISITKNNFISVYNEWLAEIGNYLLLEEIRSECYLADLMTDGKKTIAEKLKVVLKKEEEKYYYKQKESEILYCDVQIKDQKKYANFWSKYDRPPAEEYQDYILNRRDLLQPINIREVKGAFFTPKIWASKSKEFIAKAFGVNWQDEYYIWDCCCGTGNLEYGLVHQHKVFMSTLDDSDLRIMHELQTMPNATHFQFDFVNDEWKAQKDGGKIPDTLWKIIKEMPERLIIYMNPPYLEVTNAKASSGTGSARTGATGTTLKQQMLECGLGKESNELFMQFYFRIHQKIKKCKIASFSKLKNCNGPNFATWRLSFKAEFKRGFVCKANTFDNVKGNFPISFQIWDTDMSKTFQYNFTEDYHIKNELAFEVLNNDGEFEGAIRLKIYKKEDLINVWFASNNKSTEKLLAYTAKQGNDFQHQDGIALYKTFASHNRNNITPTNLIEAMIYVAVRLAIKATWLNDRDQFTKPYTVDEYITFNPRQDCENIMEGEEGIEFEECAEEMIYVESIKHNNDSIVYVDEIESNFKHDTINTVNINKPELFDKNELTNKYTYAYESDQTFIGNCIVFALFEKNYTDWQLFNNSEIGLTGVARDLTVYNLLFKDKTFSPEAESVLKIAKKIYTLYNQHFTNYNVGWDSTGTTPSILKELKKSNSTDIMIPFNTLFKEFKNAKTELAESIQLDIYTYGFLRR